MTPFWITAFLDFQADHFDEGSRFWSALTAYPPSPPRGDDAEFSTLLPPDGDAYLRMQRLATGSDRIHLDLHVHDPHAAAERAAAWGASVVADHAAADHGYVVMRSPGGLTFCFVAHSASRRPEPTSWPGGHQSMLDQVCLDIPQNSFDVECAFWEQVTGWPPRTSSVSEDFTPLERPREQPVRLLRQRTDEPSGVARAHLDWASTDRAAEAARHEALGARVVGRYAHWSVLADPTDRVYCITDREPASR